MKRRNFQSPRSIAIGVIAAAVAVVGALIATPAAVQTVSIRVVDADGRAVAGAKVCAGSAAARASRGAAITNQNGIADLRISQSESIGGQVRGDVGIGLDGSVLVTASIEGRGADRLGGIVGVLALPDTKTGPACPNGGIATRALSNFVPRAGMLPGQDVVAIRDAIAKQAAVTRAERDAAAEIKRRLDRLRASRLAREAARDAAQETAENAPRPKAQQERCFGAIGSGCGDDGRTSLCGGGTCKVSAGSWAHDECCADNPGGALCGTPWFLGRLDVPVPGQVCSGELALGAQRLATPWNWSRRVDYSKDNRNGSVVHADYCATSGTFMSSDDEEYCCSRDLRELNDAEWDRFEKANGWLSPHGLWARVCK